MGKNIRSSSSPKALATSFPMPPLADAMDAVRLSVDRFCLLAGVEALAEMMEEDATTVCGPRHRRHGDRRGYRWGRTHSEIGYHGGKVKVARPRVRDRAGKEVSLESWQALRDGNLLLEWALNLMVLNVSTRKYHRAVRLPEGDLAKARGDGTSKSAVSRRFVALSRKKMKAWLASDLSELDLLVIQIDGLHVGDHVLVAAIGVDGNGDKHVLAVALFGVRPVAHDDIDQDLGIGSHRRGPASDARRCPTGITPVRTGHVFGDGGVASIAGSAHVGGHTLAFMEELDGALGDPGPELLFGQGMGNRIVMLGDLDMVVEAGAALLPFGVLIGLGRQRLERRSVECFEQFPAGRAQMLCLPPVQVFQPFMDGLVQFGEAEETAIAQAGQNPALDDLDADFHFRFVPRYSATIKLRLVLPRSRMFPI